MQVIPTFGFWVVLHKIGLDWGLVNWIVHCVSIGFIIRVHPITWVAGRGFQGVSSQSGNSDELQLILFVSIHFGERKHLSRLKAANILKLN
jgi:hypothetical protein